MWHCDAAATPAAACYWYLMLYFGTGNFITLLFQLWLSMLANADRWCNLWWECLLLLQYIHDVAAFNVGTLVLDLLIARGGVTGSMMVERFTRGYYWWHYNFDLLLMFANNFINDTLLTDTLFLITVNFHNSHHRHKSCSILIAHNLCLGIMQIVLLNEWYIYLRLVKLLTTEWN